MRRMIDEVYVDISEKDGILKCTIRVPAFSRTYQAKIRFNDDAVKHLILSRGYDLQGYHLEKGGYLHNTENPDNLMNTWVFKKAPTVKKPTRTRKPRAKSTTNKK